MFKKKSAFTITETTITLLALGVIAILTTTSALNIQTIEGKKTRALSKVFYLELQAAYAQILYNKTSNGDISNIEISNNASQEEQNAALSKAFEEYLNLAPIDCNKILNKYKSSNQLNKYTQPSKVCMTSEKGVNAIIHFNKACDEKVQIVNYKNETDPTGLQNTDLTKELNNTCGYIAYAPKRSKGVFGEDFFVAGLKRRSIE